MKKKIKEFRKITPTIRILDMGFLQYGIYKNVSGKPVSPLQAFFLHRFQKKKKKKNKEMTRFREMILAPGNFFPNQKKKGNFDKKDPGKPFSPQGFTKKEKSF